MGTTPQFPGVPRTGQLQLLPGHATRFRPVLIAGAAGADITAVNIASTDAAANNVQFAIGKRLTLGSDMGSANFVDGGGGDDSITRSVGSFLTDGWLVGSRLGVLGATTLANDFFVILTGAVGGTLSFATATVAAAEALLGTTALYQMLNLWQPIQVAANAGASVTPSVSGLDPTQAPILDPSPDRLFRLGAAEILFARVTAALGAGETMDIAAVGADY